MNGRLYDPVLHRFLQPDNYVQDPMNSQNYNRYGYCWNNPLRYSDPSGEFFWIAAIVYAVVNVGVDLAMSNGNMNFGQIFTSAAQGFLSGGLAGAPSFGNLLLGQVSKFLPSMNIPIGDWNINFSMSMAYGNSFGVGFNVGVSYTDGDWTISGGIGVMGYDNYNGFEANSNELRYSILASYDDGKTGFSVGTNFWRGDFKQRTGVLGFKSGDFGFMYENDGGIGIKHLGLGDRNDSYRSAALNLRIGDFNAGFNLFTGARPRDKQKFEDKGYGFRDSMGVYHQNPPTNEQGTKYRLGALTIGYKGFRAGVNSEHVRHAIQNAVIHRMIGDNEFESTSWDWKGYSQYRTPNMFTSW